MNEIEALRIIFDKRSADIQSCPDRWVIQEKDKNAAFKELELLCEGREFHEIGNSFYKGIKNTTEDRSTYLWDSDCDGVSAIEIDGIKHYVFIDLKSNFDIKKIENAYLQDLYTFLKMHTLLSLCEDYSLEGEVVIDLIVACKTFKNQVQEDKVMDILFQKTLLDEESFEKKFLNDLINGNNPKCCRLNDFTCIRTLPFHQKIKNATVKLHLCLSKQYEDDSSSYRFE